MKVYLVLKNFTGEIIHPTELYNNQSYTIIFLFQISYTAM